MLEVKRGSHLELLSPIRHAWIGSTGGKEGLIGSFQLRNLNGAKSVWRRGHGALFALLGGDCRYRRRGADDGGKRHEGEGRRYLRRGVGQRPDQVVVEE